MNYIKANWNETRGDEYDSWGTSIWFLELDDENFPSRQIEVYQNGKRLKYDKDNFQDKFGMLGDQSMDIDEINGMNGIEITRAEFESEWNSENL